MDATSEVLFAINGRTVKYYIIHRPPVPWGDYGDTLQNGLVENQRGQLFLDHTGPYLPPILFSTEYVVVEDDLKNALLRSHLTGLNFKFVNKRKIVPLAWHRWDKSLHEPKERPKSGEPEDYLIKGKHCADTASYLPDVWSLEPPAVATVVRPRRIVQSSKELCLDLATTQSLDFLRSKDVLYTYVSDRAKAWLETTAPGAVTFEEASVA